MATFHIEERVRVDNRSEEKVKVLLSCQVDPGEDTLIIPDEVKVLTPDCFKGLVNVKKMILPSGMDSLCAFLTHPSARIRLLWNKARFSDLESLEYIDIKNVTFIPAGTFYECKKLRTIKSNNPLKLDKYSLLHCFSLKEIDCDETELVDALGDTELFRYPILQKDLDVAEMIVDYDYSAIKNQTDFRENWENIFASRTKIETVLFYDDQPTLVIIDAPYDSKNIDEFHFVTETLPSVMADLKIFHYGDGFVPYIYTGDVAWEYVIESLKSHLEIEIGDIDSPRDKIVTLEDALYFLKLNYLSDKLDDMLDDLILFSETIDERREKSQSLLYVFITYLTIMRDYYKGAGEYEKVTKINKYLSDASSDYLERLLSKEFDEMAHCSHGWAVYLTQEDLLPYQTEIDKAVTYKVCDAFATKLGYPTNIDFKKYDICGIVDSYQSFDYFSVDLFGSVDHLWCRCLQEYNVDPELIYPDSTFRNDFVIYMYISSLLNDDQETIAAVNKAYEDAGEDLWWGFRNDSIQKVMKAETISEEKASEYMWYDCGLMRDDVDYARFLTDPAYFEEIMPDGEWCYFLVAFDIDAIILEHDWKSFEFLRSLTENMGAEDWYQYGNFYFEEAFYTDEDIVELTEETFKTITSIGSQVID